MDQTSLHVDSDPGQDLDSDPLRSWNDELDLDLDSTFLVSESWICCFGHHGQWLVPKTLVLRGIQNDLLSFRAGTKLSFACIAGIALREPERAPEPGTQRLISHLG